MLWLFLIGRTCVSTLRETCAYRNISTYPKCTGSLIHDAPCILGGLCEAESVLWSAFIVQNTLSFELSAMAGRTCDWTAFRDFTHDYCWFSCPICRPIEDVFLGHLVLNHWSRVKSQIVLLQFGRDRIQDAGAFVARHLQFFSFFLYHFFPKKYVVAEIMSGSTLLVTFSVSNCRSISDNPRQGANDVPHSNKSISNGAKLLDFGSRLNSLQVTWSCGGPADVSSLFFREVGNCVIMSRHTTQSRLTTQSKHWRNRKFYLLRRNLHL